MYARIHRIQDITRPRVSGGFINEQGRLELAIMRDSGYINPVNIESWFTRDGDGYTYFQAPNYFRMWGQISQSVQLPAVPFPISNVQDWLQDNVAAGQYTPGPLAKAILVSGLVLLDPKQCYTLDRVGQHGHAEDVDVPHGVGACIRNYMCVACTPLCCFAAVLPCTCRLRTRQVASAASFKTKCALCSGCG